MQSREACLMGTEPLQTPLRELTSVTKLYIRHLGIRVYLESYLKCAAISSVHAVPMSMIAA